MNDIIVCWAAHSKASEYTKKKYGWANAINESWIQTTHFKFLQSQFPVYLMQLCFNNSIKKTSKLQHFKLQRFNLWLLNFEVKITFLFF